MTWSIGPGFHEIHVASAKVQQPRCKWQWRGPFFARLRLARLGVVCHVRLRRLQRSKRPKTNGVGEKTIIFGCLDVFFDAILMCCSCFFDVFFGGCVHDVLLSKIQVNKQYKNESGHPVHLVHNWFL